MSEISFRQSMREEYSNGYLPVNSHRYSTVPDNSKMTSFAERVSKSRVESGLSQKDLARLSGVRQSTISNIERGRNKGSQHVVQLAAAMKVNVNWLATGRGDKHDEMPARSTSVSNSRVDANHTITIDRLSARGSMGAGHDLMESDHVVEQLTLAADWVRQTLPRLSATQNLRVISAYGDSMLPTFNDGDLLLVDSGIKSVDLDGVFVLRTNGRLYIKRVRQRLDGTFEVRSDNPLAGTPEELSGKTKVDVLGRVVWAWNGRKL